MVTAGALSRAAAALLFGLCVASPALAEPVTVEDALGRKVTLKTPPQRIVSNFASNTELLAALGLVDRIVGIENFTRYPPEVIGKPLVGGRLGFSVDAIVGLRPDLVVMTPARQATYQLLDPMERLDIPVLVVLARTVDEVLSNIRLFARAAGVAGRGDEVTGRLNARLVRVKEATRALAPPRVVMVTGRIGNGLVLVTRPDTYTGDAVTIAGGRFALGGSTAVPQVSPEAIFSADPDVLLFAGLQKDLDELARQPGWRDMQAVRTGRAFVVPRTEFLIPGPRTVDGIERLARLLHPSLVLSQ
jgi:iron complex transport system substrate-binding protein